LVKNISKIDNEKPVRWDRIHSFLIICIKSTISNNDISSTQIEMKKQKTSLIMLVLLSVFISWSCKNTIQQNDPNEQNRIQGEYFGQPIPGKVAELFAPGIMSTGLDELNAVFFPGNKEVIFSVAVVPRQPWEWRLVMMKEENGEWSKPEVASFNAGYSGVDPFVSFDSNRIYFCSNRPKSDTVDHEDNFDIWYVDRIDKGWSAPVNMGPPINSNKHEFYPSLTKTGTIYFQSWREGGLGKSDIYCSELLNGKYEKVEILPEPINTTEFEGDALISPDGDYIIVSAQRKENNIGRADLWISFKTPGGSWSEMINMGPEINSAGSENCQILSPCGKFLFFTSRRSASNTTDNIFTYKNIQQAHTQPQNSDISGDIYWIDAEIIHDLRLKVMGIDNK
jgi:hypothetical protein